MSTFTNPYTPGAGHPPPYLAGRKSEQAEVLRLFEQDTIFENILITGLRGVGKTVLFDTFRPLAENKKWLWVGTDLSEASSISEDTLITRIFTDLAVITAGITIHTETAQSVGFSPDVQTKDTNLDSTFLRSLYDYADGLSSDKLKTVLNYIWQLLSQKGYRGIVFAYDEAQNLSDNRGKEQYPLSMILDVFQSLQKSKLPLMLALCGLPTLFPKLVATRTYTERMFHVISLDCLNKEESRQAILKPLEADDCPVRLADATIDAIYRMSGGYPYFIQFICRETYNAAVQKYSDGEALSVRAEDIQNKLDNDFFAGRWQRATDRQRDLLISAVFTQNKEFSIQQIMQASQTAVEKPFAGSSQVSQMLATMMEQGLVFKNRHGKYCLAIPLFDAFIRRQVE